MRMLFLAIASAALVAGCGGHDDDPATPAPAEVETHDLEGYSQGVRDYYGDAGPPAGGDVEAEYHQPPQPPEAGVGEAITLTGTNIGIRMKVTLRSVKPAGERTRVRLGLNNTGITVYEAPLQNARLTYAGGEPQPALTGETCSRGFDTELLRIDVGERRDVCLLFAGRERPERLQLALETVPTEAGGIWNVG